MKLKQKEPTKVSKDLVRKAQILTNRITNILTEEKVSFRTRIVGTIFIALSGGLLYLDKLLIYLNFESNLTYGFSNFSNFLWAFTQSVTPILMILGMYFKPLKFSFLIAVYCYALQLLWIFGPNYSESAMGHLFAIGFCIIFIMLVFFIKKLIVLLNKKKDNDQQFISEAKDVLEILKSKVLEGNKIEV
ncbi:hypothetical protein GCM10007384_33960 [Aquimarina muelleri]|uniref:Uncharacterized protein n=1 Tax=Aquimarina muelleri TaxID=279356 RepID=A0A918JXJ6_9FLAO|nr:hypothetical protein GCM10007384_33960 [Aquimarina muelleri]